MLYHGVNMVASQETLDKLEDIGLNMYERKIYSALLGRGVSTAGELSEMTNVPRSRAYDVLESLAEKGFSVIKSSQPMEYVAIPPQQAIENIKDKHQRELQDKLDRLDSLKDSEAVDELEDLYDQGLELVDPSEISGSLKGSHQIHQHLGTMFKDANQSIKLMLSEEGVNEFVENHEDLLEQAAEDGIEVRVLAPRTEQNEDSFDRMQEFAEVRDMSGLPEDNVPDGRMAIIDGEGLTLSMTEDEVHDTQDTAFWSKSNHLAERTMDPVFEMVWNQTE